MTTDAQIVSCHLRSRIEQLEAFAVHAELQAAQPSAGHDYPELFAGLAREHAKMLRNRIAQLRDELSDVEGQERWRFA